MNLCKYREQLLRLIAQWEIQEEVRKAVAPVFRTVSPEKAREVFLQALSGSFLK